MASGLSVRAFEADNLVNGIYRCFVRENQVVITDEVNEWVIGQADIDELEDEIEALEQSIESLANETAATLEGKADLEHTHSISEITDLQDALDDLEDSIDQVATDLQTGLNGKSNVGHGHVINDVSDLQDSLDGKSNVGHGHVISDITNLQSSLDGKASSSHTHSINDITNLQTALNSKSNVGHYHEFADIYKTETTTDENQQTITITKTLNQVLTEKENALIALIDGKAPSSHTHNATEIYYKSNRNVKQEIDDILSSIEVLDGNGDKQGILDILFGAVDVAEAIGEGALYAQIQTLQGQLATLQASFAAHIGTYAISNATDGIMEVADDLSEFSDVAAEGRTWVDSLSDWFSSFRQRIAGQTTRYNQLVNDYTSPALQSVSNESALYVI